MYTFVTYVTSDPKRAVGADFSEDVTRALRPYRTACLWGRVSENGNGFVSRIRFWLAGRRWAAGEFGVAEQIDHGRADAGTVHDEFGVVFEFGELGDGCNALDDLGVRRTEREAFEMAQFVGGFGSVPGMKEIGKAGIAAFEDGDGGEVALLAEVDTDVVVDEAGGGGERMARGGE